MPLHAPQTDARAAVVAAGGQRRHHASQEHQAAAEQGGGREGLTRQGHRCQQRRPDGHRSEQYLGVGGRDQGLALHTSTRSGSVEPTNSAALPKPLNPARRRTLTCRNEVSAPGPLPSQRINAHPIGCRQPGHRLAAARPAAARRSASRPSTAVEAPASTAALPAASVSGGTPRPTVHAGIRTMLALWQSAANSTSPSPSSGALPRAAGWGSRACSRPVRSKAMTSVPARAMAEPTRVALQAGWRRGDEGIAGGAQGSMPGGVARPHLLGAAPADAASSGVKTAVAWMRKAPRAAPIRDSPAMWAKFPAVVYALHRV